VEWRKIVNARTEKVNWNQPFPAGRTVRKDAVRLRFFLKKILFFLDPSYNLLRVKIGVVSDTHLRGANDYLRRISERFFSDAEMVIHAGDLVNPAVLKAFEGKDVRAVRGNMDQDDALPEKLIIEVEGARIGLIHGWGMPFGIEAKLLKQFENIDCLVYGHTHTAVSHVKDGVLLFNPGSPTDRMFAARNTVGVLEVSSGSVSGRILEISRKEFV